MSLKSLLFPSADKSAPDTDGPASQSSTRPSAGSGPARPPSARKLERNAHREQLYGVVRECMLRAGMLSAGYKFRALSLDGHGRHFMVMVDLLPGTAPPAQPWTIEQDMALAAQQRHGIELAGVYWRTHAGADGAHATVPAPASGGTASPLPSKAEAAPETAPGAAAQDAASAAQQAEVAALHEALAEERARAVGFDGQAVHGPQSYTLLTGFEDTEIFDGSTDPRLLPPAKPGPRKP